MADTRVQLEAEDWVRRHWLSKQLGRSFNRDRVRLQPGGFFDFDAVSDDQSIVATISTSASRTAKGKEGTAKFHKLRSDMLFLVMANVERRLMVLTDATMYQRCLKEREGGRVPGSIEFFHADIPSELAARLLVSQARAAKEVTPGGDS